MIINKILFINGIYDIICAYSILNFNNNNIFSSIHLNIFKLNYIKNNPIIRRLLAYWILTYGLIRLIAGYNNIKILYFIGALTYFIEAFCFSYENMKWKTMNNDKVNIVVILSLIFGLFIIIQC
jgi:hypothetical protein